MIRVSITAPRSGLVVLALIWFVVLPGLIVGQEFTALSESLVVRLYDGDKRARTKARYLTVEVGDSTQSRFDPSFKLTAWDGECEFRVNLATAGHTISSATRQVVTRNGRPMTRLVTATRDHELYIRKDGNFEWNIVLKEAPDTNIFTFAIETKGLQFWYQPPLGEDTIDWALDSLGDSIVAGILHRPDSVAGSYAVYHSFGRHNRRIIPTPGRDTTYETYGTGKAFHIYRPRAWDDSGKDTVWCDLNIDIVANQLSVTVPQPFLDSAVYPVTIDPTIGKQNEGGTRWSVASGNYYGNRYTLSGNITHMDSLVWWVGDDVTAGDSSSAGVYDNIIAGNNMIDCAATRDVTVASSTIKIQSATTEGASASQYDNIWLIIFADGAHQIYYDIAVSRPYGGKYYNGFLSGGCNDPCGGTNWDIGNDRQISIYMVYDEVTQQESVRRRRMLLGGS